MIQIPTTQVQIKAVKKYTLIEKLEYIVLISVILYFGKMLLIPLSFALLVSCILYPPCVWMEKKGIKSSIAITISLVTLILFIAAIIYLLFIQILSFSAEWEQMKVKLFDTFANVGIYLTSHFNISKEQQKIWLKNVADNSGLQIIPFLKFTLYSVSVSSVLFILIPIFSALILFYRKILTKALYHIFPDDQREKIHSILLETITTYYNFIKGMLLVYLIVGILNSVGLAILGIPNPILFGFIAAILTFIPYVGIMVASLLPISISWITYNSIWYPLGVILVFAIVQYLEANVIFPFAVSKRLNVNTLATIIAIIVGGILWGAAGMILFVPFVGIVKLIADKAESLKALSILLSTSD